MELIILIMKVKNSEMLFYIQIFSIVTIGVSVFFLLQIYGIVKLR